MAYSKITKSTLNIGTISETLKRSQTDFSVISSKNTFRLANLCTHNNINKWAKYKPIHHSGLTPLPDDARTDRAGDGEFYGVNVRIANLDMHGLHGVTFDYNRPKGDSTSPFRLSDFVSRDGRIGYYHLAKPDVCGSVSWQPNSHQLYMDGGENTDNIQVSFATQTDNLLCISFAEILGVASIGDLYPIVMIDDYAVALKVKDDFGNYTAAPLSKTGLRLAGLNRDFKDGTRPSDFPAKPSLGRKDVTMSVGLVSEVKNIYLGYDLNYWTYIKSMATSGFAVGVPSDPGVQDDGLCGMAVTLVTANYNRAVSVEVILASATGFSVSCKKKYSDVPMDEFVLPDSNIYTITVTRNAGSGKTVASHSVTAQVSSSDIFIVNSFDFSEFGILGDMSGSYSLLISVSGSYSGVSNTVGTGSYSSTL